MSVEEANTACESLPGSSQTTRTASETYTGCTRTSAGRAYFWINQETHPTFTFKECTFTTCSSDYGGALHFNAPNANCYYTLNMETCIFTGCTATGQGGAVYAWAIQKATITNSQFSKCNAPSDGGSLWLSRTNNSPYLQLGIDSCSFSECNSTSGSGGALIAWYLTTSSIKNSTFYNCKAPSGGGGALYLHRADSKAITFTDTQFTDNSVDGCYYISFVPKHTFRLRRVLTLWIGIISPTTIRWLISFASAFILSLRMHLRASFSFLNKS